jgi:hypothetical protein
MKHMRTVLNRKLLRSGLGRKQITSGGSLGGWRHAEVSELLKRIVDSTHRERTSTNLRK